MSVWRPVVFDTTRGGVGMWYFMCPSCPIYPLKIATPGENKERIACMAGSHDGGDRLGVVATCWHTDKDSVRRVGLDKHREVECRFNPETDLWNRPGGRIGALDQPAPVLMDGGAKTVAEAVQNLFRGATLEEKTDN